jgi:hypothetical protein
MEGKMNKRLAGMTAAILGFGIAASLPAHAMFAPFGGIATGTDPLGNTWTTTSAGWGEPGIGAGFESFNSAGYTSPDGNANASEFDFIFLKGSRGVIDAGSSVFFDFSKRQFWTASYLPSGKEVDFSAPAGQVISPGDLFFVNVGFTQPIDQSIFSFAGLWLDPSFVPEPGTLAILGLSLLGLGVLGRRKAG